MPPLTLSTCPSFSSPPPALSSNARSIGVSVGPGATQFTVIPCRASSRASDLVSDTTPPFAAEYTAPPEPTRAAACAMFTIRPLSRCIRCGIVAWQTLIVPIRFTSMSERHVFGSSSARNWYSVPCPAQFTTMSRPSVSPATRSTPAVTAAWSVTSPAYPSPPPGRAPRARRAPPPRRPRQAQRRAPQPLERLRDEQLCRRGLHVRHLP